jgi:hypothetical protein
LKLRAQIGLQFSVFNFCFLGKADVECAIRQEAWSCFLGERRTFTGLNQANMRAKLWDAALSPSNILSTTTIGVTPSRSNDLRRDRLNGTHAVTISRY